jgi:glycosyltransferase involved in cell wall biosynthesis
MKAAICTPTLTQPHPAYVEALTVSKPALEEAGIDHLLFLETGNPYISAARATVLRKALDWGADVVVFIDHDMSWRPADLLALIRTPTDVVAGTYRFKKDDEEYMGELVRDPAGRVIGVSGVDEGTVALRANRVPAGFLKITRTGVERFMRAYPQLCYGSPLGFSVDLFNHGAHEGVWWGEDYAFSRNWLALGGELFVLPHLALTHHSTATAYPGNLHEFLMREPGGANDPARIAEITQTHA